MQGMYGVARDLDLSFLEGCYLYEVGLGSFQANIRFDKPFEAGKEAGIQIRGKFSAFKTVNGSIIEHTADCAPGLGNWTDDNHRALKSLMGLLGCDVCKVEADSNRASIRLSFDEGTVVEIFDSNSPSYESFEVYNGQDRHII